MELKDTVELMRSGHYENRCLAEYRQTKIRAEKLHQIIVKLHAGTAGFKSKCGLELLEQQEAAMNEYLKAMEIRAEKEGIDVSDLI